MTNQNLLKVKHLSRFYGSIAAVNNISFHLQRGEVLGFLGPNGAGKSTTMQVITGNLAPSTGQIDVCGFDLLDSPKAAKANIGYLPEQPPLYRELSVDEYLSFNTSASSNILFFNNLSFLLIPLLSGSSYVANAWYFDIKQNSLYIIF